MLEKSPYHALGIDVGNAKVKFCALDQKTKTLRFSSRNLPYTDKLRYRRHEDFEEGIPRELSEFMGDENWPAESVAVAVTSSGYAYPSYGEGVSHLFLLLKRCLPDFRVFALDGAAEAAPVDEILKNDPAILCPIEFSNGMGAVQLAMRLEALADSQDYLVLDTGGSTTAITPVIGGRVDPAAFNNPQRHLDHRLQNGKLTWIGVQTTPLEYLAHEVAVGGRRYPVIPRGVTFDNVAAVLDLLPPKLARQMTLFRIIPDRWLALRAVADAVNLDFMMANEEELETLASNFHRLAIERLAEGIRAALKTVPAACKKAIAFGIGAKGLTYPALLLAGVEKSNIILAESFLGEDCASYASCYGAFHKGLELICGKRLKADISDIGEVGSI